MFELKDLNAIWSTIKPSGSGRLIPDGEHIAVLDDMNFVDETMTLWCKWRFPDFEDRVLSNPINFSDRAGNVNQRGVGDAMALYATLGAPLNAAEDVKENIAKVVGSRVRVKLVTTTSATNGKKYTKIYPNELLGKEAGGEVPFEI